MAGPSRSTGSSNLESIMPNRGVAPPAAASNSRPERRTIPPHDPRETRALRLGVAEEPWTFRWGFIVPLALMAMGIIAVSMTQAKVGYAWDEAYYYEPAKAAAHWVIDLFAQVVESGGDPAKLPTWNSITDSIASGWEERSEHPSFQKILSGFSLIYLEDSIGAIRAMRLPMAFLYGATLVLIYLLGRRTWGSSAGLLSAFAYFSMPRVFGHAHFASMETPLVFSTLLFVYCFIRGVRSRFWSILTGISLGLLLATKINGFFMIPPMLVWGYIYGRPRVLNNFFWMLILGPMAFVAFWPWLWTDTIHRVLEYLSFHAGHQQTAVYFEGVKWGYGDALAPWYYPSMILYATLPISVLLFGSLGILASIFELYRRPLFALFLLLALVQWGVASAPGTPKYDGERLFLPIFPFIALLAGGGANVLLGAARWRDRKKGLPGSPPRMARNVAVLFGLVILVETGINGYTQYPYFLSSFNSLVGGLNGAEQKGFETTYWGEAVNEDALKTINEVMPKDGKLKVLALHEKCFEHLQKWGFLRSDIKIGGEPPYDMHLLLWRRGFFTRPEKALAETSTPFPAVAKWENDGVTLLSLHKTGEAFERYWPTLSPPPGSPEMEIQTPVTDDAPTTATSPVTPPVTDPAMVPPPPPPAEPMQTEPPPTAEMNAPTTPTTMNEQTTPTMTPPTDAPTTPTMTTPDDAPTTPPAVMDEATTPTMTASEDTLTTPPAPETAADATMTTPTEAAPPSPANP